MKVLLREYYDFDWTVTGQQNDVSTDGGSSSESDKYRIVFSSDLTKRILVLFALKSTKKLKWRKIVFGRVKMWRG